MEKTQDIILGLVMLVIGLTAAWLARSYTGAGGTYPMVLGAVLAVLGMIVAVRAVRSTANAERTLVDAPLQLVIALGVGAAYIAMVVPVGFYTSSLMLMFAIPLALGFRRPVYLSVTSIGFVAIVYIVFSILLEKPLPAEFWAGVRMESS